MRDAALELAAVTMAELVHGKRPRERTSSCGCSELQLAAKGASKSAEPSELLAANGADKLVRVL